MTLSDLASIATVISGLAVLVSLVYLSLQTRQNTKHTMALIQQGRTEQSIGYWFTMAEDATLTDAILKAEALDPTLDRVQFQRYLFTSGASISFFEDQFYQHRDGLLDEDRYAASIKMILMRLQNAAFRACWTLLRDSYNPDFQVVVDGLMSGPIASVPDAFEAWKSLATAELTRPSA